MKTSCVVKIFGCIICLCFLSCSGRNEVTKVMVGESTGVKISAIGVEFDPHYFSQNEQTLDTESWQMVEQRVKNMKASRFRVMVLPQWFEPVNDNDNPEIIDWSALTFDSQEMYSLYRVLDLAEQMKIEVTLVLWGCATMMNLIEKPVPDPGRVHFLAEGNKGNDWVIGTKKSREFAENFSILVQHLLFHKKYNCITEITPFNEPSWAFIVDEKVSPEGYVEVCRALDARFRKDGIRDKVRFNLSDDAENADFLQMCAIELADIADVFNSHTYKFGYETPNSEIRKWENNNRRLATSAGKEHFVGEFGSNQTVGASRQKDIDLYERGVLMVRIALNLLNSGANGVSYWSLLDQYYLRSDPYGSMQQLGLWRAKKAVYKDEPYYNDIDEDYQVRPQYHAYSLLTRFVQPGADVFPIAMDNEFAAGTAFKGTDEKWTCFFVNGGKNEMTIEMTLPENQTDTNFQIYRYTRGELPLNDKMLDVWKTISCKKKITISLPAESVIVCRQ